MSITVKVCVGMENDDKRDQNDILASCVHLNIECVWCRWVFLSVCVHVCLCVCVCGSPGA